MLRDIEVLRVERGLAATGPARLGLRSLDGKRQRVVEVPLITRASPNGDKPPSVALLDGNIGHLRIPKMIDSDADTVARWMDTLRNTSGLIIDVRGNPGGSRDLLRLLAPYFIDPNEAYVSSIARYRIGPLDVPDAQQGYLADRGMYPRSSDRFSETEQLALMRAERSFAPDWQPPNIDDFSPLHFLVHRKADNPLAYRYERPVVVLTDHESFSATDLFANAFKGRPGVTLIGRATGGGSGNANGYWFPFGTPRYGKDFVDSVGLLTLSSMVSYAANGRLIEGMGIEPDIVVPLGAMEATGRSDATLDAAISHLGGEPPPIAGMEVVKET